MTGSGVNRERAWQALFAPRAVAVVGASDDTRKWGNWVGLGALRGEGRRRVHLINARAGTVLGRPALASPRLGGPIDLAVIAVPAPALRAAVEDSLAAGARALVVITAVGGAAGRRREADRELAGLAREAGAVLVGPNCLGVFDAGASLELVPAELPPGEIGFVSQSGNLGLEVGELAGQAGLGFSRFVSLGNQADLEAADVVGSLVSHAPTRLIALHIEDFRDGRRLVAAAAAARRAGKRVVLLAPDATAPSARMAAAHTGSVVSSEAAIAAACRIAGVDRVADPGELVALAGAILRGRRLAGRRVAVVADGGGHAGLAACLAQRRGLELPRLSAGLSAALAAGMPDTAEVANPIDLAGAGERDLASFHRTADRVLGSGEVDGVLVAGGFGGYSEYSDRFAAEERGGAVALADAARTRGGALVVHTMYPGSAAADELRARGVPVHGSLAQAVRVLAGLWEPPVRWEADGVTPGSGEADGVTPGSGEADGVTPGSGEAPRAGGGWLVVAGSRDPRLGPIITVQAVGPDGAGAGPVSDLAPLSADGAAALIRDAGAGRGLGGPDASRALADRVAAFARAVAGEAAVPPPLALGLGGQPPVVPPSQPSVWPVT